MTIPIIGQKDAEIPVLEEHVPIPVDKLAAVKQQLANSEDLTNQAAQMGITVSKAIAQAAQLGVQAQQLENEVRLALREIIVETGVKPNEFRGFDFDKGVINVQREGVSDVGSV